MGQEILYCYKCQTRLLGSEFEKGKAFKVGGQASCADCVKDLLASMPEAARPSLKPTSSTRIPAVPSESTSKFKVPAPRALPAPEAEKSKSGLIIGAVLGVVALIILIAMAMSSGSGPTVRRDPDPPTPMPLPPVVRPGDPPSVTIPPATPSFAAELREIDDKIRTGLANDDFKTLTDFLAEARKRRPTGEWLSEIDLRVPQVEARARRSAVPLREKAVEANKKSDAAEVKRLRDRIAAWGFPSIVDEFDKALAAPVAPPTPPPDPNPPPAEGVRLVYAEALGPACRSCTWGGVVDFAATAQAFEGKQSIAFTPQQNAAGVYVALDQDVDPAEYPFVTFALYLADNAGVGVALYRDWKPAAPVGLEHLGGYPALREWKKYVVPVAQLNPTGQRLTGFIVQVFRTATQPILYVDSVSFLKTAPAGTVLPKPPVDPAPAEPPLVVYDDALAPGWRNWSWGGLVDFAAGSPVFQGSKSMSLTAQKDTAALALHFEQGIDPAQYPFLSFAAYVVDDTVDTGVALYMDKVVAPPIRLKELVPDFKGGEWRKYVIPAAKLNSKGNRITGLQIQTFNKVSPQPLVYVDSVSFLKGAPAGAGAANPSSATGIDGYRARWSLAAAKAALRDYAAALREVEEAASTLKDDAGKAEAASDLELVKLAAQVPVEAAKAIERWTKGQKVKLDILNAAGEREPVEGTVVAVDPTRLTVLRDSGALDLPLSEIAPSSLAEIFRARSDRKPTDPRAAAAFCFFEGEPDAARKQAAGASLPEKLATLTKERSAAEVAARRLFWTAEADFTSPRRRAAAVEKYAAFLAGEPASLVARLKPYVAARLEAAKDTVFLADDLSGGGTFVQGSSPKLDVVWIGTADGAPSDARKNFVEAEFHAFHGAAYRAWIWTGACCQETFEFFLQGTELTGPNAKPCEPGGDAALPAKLPSITLRKWHAQHGGPKEPAKWEWIPVTLPKYESAGPKKLRVLSAQQGFSVGAIVVSAIRRETPKETEIKELEKARFGSRKSANTGPQGVVVFEYWENIDGDTVADLVKHPSFAGKPSGTLLQDSLEGPKGFKDRYGSRMRGYLHPSVTGAYAFWLASDDCSEFHLSLDDTPARKRVVCSLNGSVGHRNWNIHPSQKSTPVVLMAGKRYYFEVFQKDGGGDDHVSVGWTLPDGTEEKPIPGSRLSPWGAAPQTPGPPGTVFFRGYNINGPPTTIDGRRWEGKGHPTLAFSGELENQSVPLNPPTDDVKAAMIRTSAFTFDGTFVKVYQMPAGTYQVYYYVWEDNFDQVYDILLQGKEVLKGHHSGTAGHWDKLGPFTVTLPEGGTLDFKTNGGHANVSGVEIWKVVK